MTRKDYKVFAELIKTSVNNPEIFTITDLANELCEVFKKDNPNFKKDLFLKACDLN
jgi:dihydroneopterin aldolase|tara:strand:- start:395 stop:562 length:168 start_codon:yes stop_codon:yes gene_type:complete